MAEENKTILVVDDEPDVAQLLSLILKADGYNVLVAGDGQEALEKARKGSPDLILLDVMLPKMDGYRVARMLKFDENFRHIPIIMLTAKIQEKDKKTGLEMGADDYMTKPFEVPKLQQKVREILARKGKAGV
jgi:DNA-binding response OmpR family regulator